MVAAILRHVPAAVMYVQVHTDGCLGSVQSEGCRQAARADAAAGFRTDGPGSGTCAGGTHADWR
jgi:hypothetical protein